LGYDTSRSDETLPSILICIPWREPDVSAMLQRPWIVETDPNKADFIIATELWPCGRDQPVELIDEVKRFDRTFAWIYARRSISAALDSADVEGARHGRDLASWAWRGPRL
jgi:hypothetical protein